MDKLVLYLEYIAEREEPVKGEGSQMFSQTIEYAVRAVIMLAYLEEQGPVGNTVLAERSQVPPSYLSKVLQGLVKSGIVSSRRGVGGGFKLARSPEEITILDIVNAVDPIARIRGCPLGLESHSKVLCPMHARLDEAMKQVEEVLARSTVAELLLDPDRPIPMVETVAFLQKPQDAKRQAG